MSLQRTFIKMEGQMVEDRYQLQNLLGVGGFGGVFKGQDVFLGKILRNVAIKIIAPLDIENFAGLSKEKREAEYTRQQGQQRDELGTAVNLSHPHVVTGFHVGLWRWQGEDYLYLVMELAQGTLQDELRDKQPSEAEVVDILLQVARGLDYLHREKRLIHRDIKPGNILRCQEQWKLSDFGLSRQMSDKSQSRTGNIAGTIAFMPPEAFGNESVVSTAWDMWSLGILGAALVDGGRLPFNYQSEMDLMLKIYQGDVKLPTRIPERLAPVVTNCLLKDRSKRWSAAQVIEYLSNRQNTTIDPKASSIPQPVSPEVELKSDVGMDYSKLHDLLKAGKWEEADKETLRVMLAIVKREEECYLRGVKDIDNFPCADLRTIDQLWVKYSNGRFGFSVQKQIYHGLGGTREFNREIWEKFAEKIGWRIGGLWLYDSYAIRQASYDIKAPKGCLPRLVVWGGTEVGGGGGYIFSRVQTCRL
ncbi:serine/threonine-protein kinase [Microcystis aeruginosa]|uniref:serine/threonine-protein kinase n=1 Tax=Microcystis aeruginosa TaxID=1126 RepID=UPI00046987EB|nr:serine/threonine-protein kinase [Microcystis aeruginosa]